ncbi:MAG: hypothetical protein GX267_17165 [Fibrobacter sp.]|jgi:chromosome segregation ATPase|nr:hypothetical protein [Fibrobacter sp.]
MNTAKISDILMQIKELYSSIKQISTLLVDDFSEETLEKFLRTRERLLKEVYSKEAEYTRLRTKNTENSKECSKLKNEISELIRAIISLDNCINEKIASNMRNIRKELSSLHGSSRAALAYSSQRRI